MRFDGARQTMLEFKTDAAAVTRVAERKQRANAAIQCGSCVRWRC